MSNNGSSYQAWYKQMVGEKERLEKELNRVSKLTDILGTFVAEEKGSNATELAFSGGLVGEFEQLATLNKKIQTLYFLLDVIRALSAENDINRRYKLIIEKAAQLVDADKSIIFLHDPENNELCSKARENQDIVENRFPNNTGIAGHVYNTGKTISLTNPSKSKNFDADIDERLAYRAKNLVAVPLQDDTGKILGVLEIYNKNNGPFTSDDEYLLKAFGAQAATAIKSVDDDASALQVSNTMLLIMKALASGLDIDSLLVSLVKKSTQLMNADRSSLFLIDFSTRELWSKVAEGNNLNEIRFPMTAGIAGHVATSGETLNIEDAYEDSRFNREIDLKTGYRTRTILCAPIRNESGKVIGVLQVLNKKADVFDHQDERLIHAFTSQVGKVLKSSQFLLNLITIMEEAKSFS